MGNWIKYIVSLLFLLFSINASTQELKCQISLNYEQVEGTNKTIFESLEKEIIEFVNTNRWTNYDIEVSELIECSMYITVNSFEASTNAFNCEIQIQSIRPVYNSTYKTPTFSFNDKDFNFTYFENDPLGHDELSFGSNLTEVLAYYAYLIIGSDCDSYTPLGGTEWYKKAESIVNQAQSVNQVGWRAFESHRNRYALVNNFLDENLKEFRQFYYEYHRFGLDEMTIAPDKSRERISTGLPLLTKAFKKRPNSILIQEFAEAKVEEIANIFSKATQAEKKEVYDIITEISPNMQAKLVSLKP